MNTIPQDPKVEAAAWKLAQTQYFGHQQMKWQPQPTKGDPAVNKSRLKLGR
jgi:hypothetical protein